MAICPDVSVVLFSPSFFFLIDNGIIYQHLISNDFNTYLTLSIDVELMRKVLGMLGLTQIINDILFDLITRFDLA